MKSMTLLFSFYFSSGHFDCSMPTASSKPSTRKRIGAKVDVLFYGFQEETNIKA